MDNENQIKTHTAGHENHGVYVCHKCGWPFPNPHPSARHRRAHKRICGTIEGYKLVDSQSNTHLNASDDEHLSDEDRKEPSPKLLETSKNGMVVGGNGERLTRAESEVYCDAATEFPDSGISSVLEEQLPHTSDLSRLSESKDVGDVSQFTVKSGDIDEIENFKVLKSTKNDFGTQDLQNPISSSTNRSLEGSVSDSITEESSVIHKEDSFTFPSDLFSSKVETISDASEETKTKAGENVTDSSTSIEQATEARGNTEVKLDRDPIDVVIASSNGVGERFGGVSKLEVIDVVTSDTEVAGALVELKDNDNVQCHAKLPQGDILLDVESVENTEGSVPGLQFASSSDSVKNLQEKREGNDNVYVLSVPDDIPGVAHPEMMVQDFKDHERVKLRISTSHFEEANTWNPVPIENSSSFQSRHLSEDREVSPADIHFLDKSREQEKDSSKPMVKELPVEGKADVSPNKLTIDDSLSPDETGISLDLVGLMTNESYTVQFSGEQESGDFRKNSLQKNLPEDSSLVSSGANPIDVLPDSGANQTASIIDIDNVGHHEKSVSLGNDKAGNDKHQGSTEENDNEVRTTIIQATSIPSQVPSQVEDKQSNYVPEDVDACEYERGKIEKCYITEFQSNENILPTESAGSVHESLSVSEDAMDESLRKIRSTEFIYVDQVSDTQEGMKEDDINNNKVKVECSSNVTAGADLQKSGDVTSLVEASENRLKEDPLLSPLYTESSAQSFTALGDNKARESGALASEISSLPSQDQHDNNLVKQQFGASGVDASVYSSSRSDSLEGNWGSVSVLSLQSDAQAVIDTEILPSTESQASAEAEKSHSNRPNTASEGCQSGKLEMFEPPSFMTLVEPGGLGDKKTDISEVQIGQNPQHPNSSSSQAAWFPSIAQVVNESPGRKKNEEIIAKVTNWSAGKQHVPLKSLLGEAAHDFRPVSPNLKDNVALVPKDNSAKNTTVNSILGPESPPAQSARDAGKEWNSPARYPSDIKREKTKVKGRSYWIQFMCCSSVNSH
ncbi:GPI-anchored adhesin-like protein [Quillaja saponaria]|uniref:GPI-anchored adhesin-like protein n=1 Tax=Quillaja saponaria TaxID=32244 RepID=A0AAD7QCQ5_QUISA|nr:GPI-anchored adhesin-like protein [Quillaja saponaria]